MPAAHEPHLYHFNDCQASSLPTIHISLIDRLHEYMYVGANSVAPSYGFSFPQMKTSKDPKLRGWGGWVKNHKACTGSIHPSSTPSNAGIIHARKLSCKEILPILTPSSWHRATEIGSLAIALACIQPRRNLFRSISFLQKKTEQLLHSGVAQKVQSSTKAAINVSVILKKGKM